MFLSDLRRMLSQLGLKLVPGGLDGSSIAGDLSMVFSGAIPLVKIGDSISDTDGEIIFVNPVPLDGCSAYGYFAEGVLEASPVNPAGFYYIESIGNYQARVYREMYVPGPGVIPQVPATKTPFGTTVGGNGVTGEITFFQCTLPANTLTSTGKISHRINWLIGDDGASQTLKCYLGVSETLSFVMDAPAMWAIDVITSAIGVAKQFTCISDLGPFSPFNSTAEDTTDDLLITVTGDFATAGCVGGPVSPTVEVNNR